jgi:hypothetical protein
MGKITTQLVVTGAERKDRPKAIQPGNREWVTMIQVINATGWTIPPFLVFAGQYHLSAWYEEAEVPRDWAIAISDNQRNWSRVAQVLQRSHKGSCSRYTSATRP